MPRRLAAWLASTAALVALLLIAPGCKGMGGVMSGLGKVAAGAAHGVAHAVPAVARGMAKAAPAVTRGVAHAGGAVARGVAHTAPTVLRATEAVVETAADAAWTLPDVEVGGPVAIEETVGPPGSEDPCQACPLEVECGVCAGYAGYACLPSPAGALARCESSAPPDAPPAPPPDAPPPPPLTPPPPPGASPGATML